MKLHLGCGEKYLDGYINIDFPAEEHSVQLKRVADKFCDIKTLSFGDGIVDEIRLHHLFEHFPRYEALALLARWTQWLKQGGILRIETPDFLGSILKFISPFTSEDQRGQIIRHLFGSHEAPWATHYDAWYPNKFKSVLEKFGFDNVVIKKNHWGVTKNIEVIATRGNRIFGKSELREISEKILIDSLIKIDTSTPVNIETVDISERNMLRVWMQKWDDAFKA